MALKIKKTAFIVPATLLLASCSLTPVSTPSTPSISSNTSINIVDPSVVGPGNGGISLPETSTSPTTPSYEPWVGDIIDLDEPYVDSEVEIDDTVYDYTNLEFDTVAGEFDKVGNTYTSTLKSSMARSSSTTSPFTHGTFSVDVKYVTPCDSGIIFGLNDNGSEKYWEGYGISYYFFFLNTEGDAYLAKSVDGKWIECSVVGAFVPAANEVVNLKVLYYGDKIICMINNVLYITYQDDSYLTGTGFGFRAGATGMEFSNIFASSDRVL